MQSNVGGALTSPGLDEDVGDYLSRRLEWMTRCAYLLTRDADAARDLAQDAGLRAWAARDRVAAATDRDAYVARIMLNVLRSQHRRRTVPVVDAPAGLDSLPLPTGASAEDAVTVVAALEDLSQRQRAAVVLRFWSDFTDQQIADALGCRPGTARSLLSRSMKKLRLSLEDQDG
ncbi:SigE family RNA polymerase sigma factor [Nocardioides hankookensis]